MGSYLSVLNDATDPVTDWYVKIGPDEAAIGIFGAVSMAIGAIAATAATAGAGAPLVASLAANGVVEVLGVSTSTLAAITSAAASISGVSYAASAAGLAKAVADIAQKQLSSAGMVLVPPGGKQTYGKMSLSLWQQATCMRTRFDADGKLYMDTLYMRPIFSGPTDNSNNDHSIQWWINKWGWASTEVSIGVASDESPSRALLSEPPHALAPQLNGKMIQILAPSGHMLRLVGNTMGTELRADTWTFGPKGLERFKVAILDGGDAGRTFVALQTLAVPGHPYLGISSDNKLVARSNTVTDTEKFEVVFLPSLKPGPNGTPGGFALRQKDKYLSFVDGGGHGVTCDKPWRGAWEVLQWRVPASSA